MMYFTLPVSMREELVSIILSIMVLPICEYYWLALSWEQIFSMHQILSFLMYMAILSSWLQYYNLSDKIGNYPWTMVFKATLKALPILNVSTQMPLGFIENVRWEVKSRWWARICVFLRTSGMLNWRIFKSQVQRWFWPGSPIVPISIISCHLLSRLTFWLRQKMKVSSFKVMGSIRAQFPGVPCAECIYAS